MAYIVSSYSSAISKDLEVFFESNINDIVLLTYSDRYSTYSQPTGTSWTPVVYNKTTYNGADNAVWWKRATINGSDSVAITVSSANCGMNIHIIRGVDVTTPFDVTTVSRPTGGQNPLQSNQITPVSDNTLIFHHVFSDGFSGLFTPNIIKASDAYKTGYSTHYSTFSYSDSGVTTPIENFYFSTASNRSMTWITFAFRDDGTNQKVGYVDETIMSSELIMPAWSLGSNGIFTNATANIDLTSTGSNLIPTVNGYITSVPYNFGSIGGISNGTDYRKVNCALACTSRISVFNVTNKIIALRSRDDNMNIPYQPIGKNVIIGDGTNFRRYKIDAKDTSPSSSNLDIPILINPSANTHKEDFGVVNATVLTNINHFAIAGAQPNTYAGSSYDRIISLNYLPIKGGSILLPCNMNNVVQASKIQDLQTIQNQSGMAIGQFVCFQSFKIMSGAIWDSTGQSIEYSGHYNEGGLRTSSQINSGDLFFEVDNGIGNTFTLDTQSINMGDFHWFKLTSGNPLGSGNVISNAQLQLEKLDGGIIGYTFDNCKEIQYTLMHDFSLGNIFAHCVDIQSITINGATQGALQTLINNIANCTFSNNNVAIRIEYTGTGNITLNVDNIKFSSNTIDIHYNSTNASILTANMANGSNATTSSISGNATSVVIANDKTFTIIIQDTLGNVLTGAEVTLLQTGTQTESFHIETSATGTEVFTFTAPLGTNVDMQVFKPGYERFWQANRDLGINSSSITVQLNPVPAYEA